MLIFAIIGILLIIGAGAIFLHIKEKRSDSAEKLGGLSYF